MKRNRIILLYAICFAALAFVFSKVTQYFVHKDTPTFVVQAYEELKRDNGLNQDIGIVEEEYEYSYSENDAKKDTIPFYLTVHGKRQKVEYKCTAIRSLTDSTYHISYDNL